MRTTLAFLLVFPLVGCTGTTRGKGDGGTGQCPAACTKGCDGQGVCHDCTPLQTSCAGDVVVECNPDGTFGATVKTCDTSHNERCTGGVCLSACEVAASSHDYIGCDYWPTTTVNGQLNPYFDFAVAVANPLTVGDVVTNAPANITITIGTMVVAQKSVAPGAVETIILPWVPEVSQNEKQEQSVDVPEGAYHLVSDLPVTVYQFNPLQFEKPQTPDCMDQIPMGGVCHSYTNDASILLPTTALKTDYMVMARGTFAVTPFLGSATPIPGFFAVVATQDGTQVNVTYSAYTEAGTNVPAQTPGSMASYMLDAGEVLEVVSKRATKPCVTMSSDQSGSYCDLGPTYDLTGTKISATKPIAVFGGHSCAFVPYNKWACDHVEEQMFPLDTWGQKIVVAQTEPQTGGEANVWRVLSGTDANQITFDPPSVHGAVTLDAGKFVEFSAQGGFMVTSTGRVAVGQFMVGENATMQSGVDVGDPALGLGVPVEQYRDSYDFLSPSTYTKNYLMVIAPANTNLTLDDQPVPNMLTAIGGSGFGYQRIPIMAGAHHIKGDQRFGIAVSGIANFTSYLYVGGLNLNEIPLQ